MRKGVTRRGALQGGAALAAASLAATAKAKAPASEKADVIVIGGGLAGLNSALTLSDAGLKTIVLEASERVGGRCFTADGAPERPEYGASQIGAGYARVLDVCRRFGVALGPGANLNAPLCFAIDGQLVSKEAWRNSPLNRTVGAERAITPQALPGYFIRSNIPAMPPDGWMQPDALQFDVSFRTWLERVKASPEAIRLINSGLVDPNIDEVSFLSMLHEYMYSMAELEAFADQNLDRFEAFARTSQHVVDGTQRVPEAMARHLGDGVRLGMEVRDIAMDKRGVTVTCADGSRFKASYAISAIPMQMLRKIAVSPGLSGPIGNAVARIGRQRQSQVFMTLKGEPYWQLDGLDASIWSDGPINLTRQQIGYDGERRLVTALAFGPRAVELDKLKPKERGEWVVRHLGELRPSMKGKLEVIAVQSWEEQSFVHGCRHSFKPGDVTRYREVLEEPFHRMYFAGEHVRRLAVGMEAAMESGEAAALQIVERS